MSHTNPLPELPEPAGVIVVSCSALRAFIADQMHAYGRECYDLGARSTAAQPLPEAVEWETLDGTRRTTDKSMAQNWEAHVGVRVVRRAAANAMRNPRAAETWCGEEAALRALNGAMAAAQPPAAAQPVEPTSWLPVFQSQCAGRVYVAGPMTGLPDYNFPAFFEAEARLQAKGLHVENPARHGVVAGAVWADYLRADVQRLATCESIYLLPGWSRSKGAMVEVDLARALGLTITFAEGAELAAPPAASGDSTPPSEPVQGDPSGALRPEPEAVGQDRVRAWTEAPGAERVWTCKVGGPVAGIPNGGDSPMRAAVSQAFEQVTGFEARFIFSGWGGELTEGERAVVENRPAMPTFEVRVAGPDDVFSYSDELFALRHANSVNQAYLADRAKHPDSEVLCVATVHAAEPPQAASGSMGD